MKRTFKKESTTKRTLKKKNLHQKELNPQQKEHKKKPVMWFLKVRRRSASTNRYANERMKDEKFIFF